MKFPEHMFVPPERCWVVDTDRAMLLAPAPDEAYPDPAVIFRPQLENGCLSASIVPTGGLPDRNFDQDFREASLLFRYRHEKHFCAAGIGGFGHAFFIAKAQSERWTKLHGSGSVYDLTFDQLYRLRVEFERGQIRLTCNGQEVACATDDTYTAGACGVRTNRTAARFEDVKIGDSRVFIVHGHDEAATVSVARFLEQLQLVPVILRDEPHMGRTIIDKFEQTAADISFAIVLLTPDDQASSASKKGRPHPRARQNAIFELGYFIASMGRDRVCPLVKGDLEFPSDYGGVGHIAMDVHGGWKLRLATELSTAGFEIDMERLVRRT